MERGIVEGNGHVTTFVVERQKPSIQSCEFHGNDCVVSYTGARCPMCLLADELEQERIDRKHYQDRADELKTEVEDLTSGRRLF